jgi:hypothetical protein
MGSHKGAKGVTPFMGKRVMRLPSLRSGCADFAPFGAVFLGRMPIDEIDFTPFSLCWFRKILLRILLGVDFPRCAGLRCALPSLREGYAGELISSSGNERGWTAAMRGTSSCVRTSFSSHHPLSKKVPRNSVGPFLKMERVMRFELTTSTLARLRSTPELHPHRVLCLVMGGAPAWDRWCGGANYTLTAG